MKDGGSAFPVYAWQGAVDPGMTLRDWFAGQALTGMIQDGYQQCGEDWIGYMAKDAYKIADAMLVERENKK